MLADRLAKAWKASGRTTPASTVMCFSDKGLVLGAGTVLAPAGASPRDIRVDPLEPRLQALLTAAHLRRPTGAALAHLRKAAERCRGGEDALAAMRLALSGLDRLQQPEADSHRLFLADGLMKTGVTADEVVAALEPLAKYDPDQPRVPAGSGRPSGQWTSGDGGATGGASASGKAPHAPASGRSLAMPARRTSPPASPAPTPRPPSGSPIGPHTVVNPSTVTPAATRQFVSGIPYYGEDACAVAMDECETHAIFADADPHPEADPDSVGDAAGSNFPTYKERMRQCYQTGDRCLDAQAEVLYGRARAGIASFPDGGLVIMRRGQEDVYYPPGWKGRIPPIWRIRPPGPDVRSTCASSLPPRNRPQRPPTMNDDDAFPPWQAASGETPATDATSFADCDEAIDAFAARAKGKVTDRSYTQSADWGRILRARVAVSYRREPSVLQMTRWSGPGSGVAFAMRLDAPAWSGS